MPLIDKWWKSRRKDYKTEENLTDLSPESTQEQDPVPAPEAEKPSEIADAAPETTETASETIETTSEATETTTEAAEAEEASAGISAEAAPVEETAAEPAAEAEPAEEVSVEKSAEPLIEEASAETTAEAVPAEETAAEPAAEEEAVEPAAEAESAEEEAVAETSDAAEETAAETSDEAEETAPADSSDGSDGSDVTEENLLDTLEPADVFKYFRDISGIPHGSFHTTAISDYLENFAKNYELPYTRDEMGNLIICRPGSAGYENADPIALQGHVDMVCEKESSNPIDMDTEAISLRTDGEWLWADRTTLGGDDGIAVAIMLALLADDTITCPPLECIFTVDEEVGMRGAFAMDLSSIKSRRLLNLDSEQEGIITAACAGGAEEICTLPGRRREKTGEVLELSIEGLRGGHSGECIGIGRANASILLARLLYRLEQTSKICLIDFHGGTRDNAIPREAKAWIIFTGKFQRGKVKDVIAAFAKDIAKEYSITDPDIKIHATLENKGKMMTRSAFTRKDSLRMIRFLLALPNGVLEFTPMYRDVPQTSLSLGIVNTVADGIRTHSLVRSSVNSQKQMVMDKIECIAEEFGASVTTEGTYPAWELIAKSDFRDLAAEIFKKTTGREPTVCVIHGGLECGLISSKVPGIDCISVGPDMEEIHTPAERLNIPSTRRIYDYVKALLEACVKA
ncbi:MAG: beta-Ala-His dipeptidase [Lachnospiraceae bacterium]|nr:beta-Ala-His dipeptidase [Lachnospiraceae bacterium]